MLAIALLMGGAALVAAMAVNCSTGGSVGATSSDADRTSSFVVCFAALPTAYRNNHVTIEILSVQIQWSVF
jgi:F0F1-type ATP synthase membrane subunit c/vacuolar-type H+-ATPase subunit K